MMGQRKREQEQLFYSFCLDDAVPDDHSVRELSLRFLICRGCMPSWRAITPGSAAPRLIQC